VAEKHEVRFGTSGWQYPLNGYGPWTGVFYPLKQGQTIPGTKAKFDNSATTPSVSTLWKSTAPSTAQRPSKPLSRGRREPQPASNSASSCSSNLPTGGEVTQEDVDVFKRGIDPLADAD